MIKIKYIKKSIQKKSLGINAITSNVVLLEFFILKHFSISFALLYDDWIGEIRRNF